MSEKLEADDFAARLARAKADREGNPNSSFAPPKPAQPALGPGFRIGIDLSVGIIAGVVTGWLLDRWLGTKPWLLIVMFFVGTAAGFINVWRGVKQLGYQAGYRPSANPGTAEKIENGKARD